MLSTYFLQVKKYIRINKTVKLEETLKKNTDPKPVKELPEEEQRERKERREKGGVEKSSATFLHTTTEATTP